jgi:hypothetical protein
MIIKSAVTLLLIVIVLFRCTSTSAGSVEVGFVNDAGLDHWMAGGSAEIPTGETALRSSEVHAKFGVPDGCNLKSFLASGND